MHTPTLLVLCLACGGWLAGALAAEDLSVPPPMPSNTPAPSPPQPTTRPVPAKGPCKSCGVIRSIRQTETESRRDDVPTYIGSPQYLEQRDFSKPIVGPVLGITFGKGQATSTYVGAAGSETMRRRILQITYEVTVAFDDGRFGLIELPDVGDFRVGDRVKVDGSRLELVKQ
jgi:hypothetical protein